MSGPQWLSNEDLAERYQVPLATIRAWRAKGYGPRGVRLGRHVRTSVAACEQWEREQMAAQAPR